MLSREELRAYRWGDASEAPLISHPAFSPLIADPVALPPEQTPDGAWRLYAHSAWGIHEYASADGRAWKDRGIILRDAMRPWVMREGDAWYMLYERYRTLGMAQSLLPGRTWRSHIEMRSSPDLRRWGKPITLLEPCLTWHEKPGLGRSVGNPCLVRAGAGWRLYYSAGLVRVPDCGFNEPEFVGLARSDRIEGPFAPETERMLSPDPSDPEASLSRGSLRVMRLSDGWAGFENGISFSAGRSRSAILLLFSRDGLRWERLAPAPIVSPSPGWRRSHVYAACPVAGTAGEILLYYNARDDWPISRGRERIGLAIGTPPKEAQ
jgi:hypothetical protein